MQKNLVIVESPAKAKTIEKFLGKDYKVLSSFGHIRDLSKKDFGVDIAHNYKPIYEVSSDKKKIVSELKSTAKDVETVWLASDEDREGEAIAWHLYTVLNLEPEKTRRIVFHEITKEAILNAIETPREIDINLVNAQQARRVLDRIVGFELSPVLWKKIKPSLSAGRVQSVAVRLIVERERDIQKFEAEAFYKVAVIFNIKDAEGNIVNIKAELQHRLKTKEEALALLEKFVHSDTNLPPLVRAGMIHYQFEAIHPFLDGNGRVGRLLIGLLLCEWELLPQPLLNLSAYIENYRQEYYDRLLAVSQQGAWESWLHFFLRGVSEQAADSLARMKHLQSIRIKYQPIVEADHNPQRMSAMVDFLFTRPILSVKQVSDELKMPFKTAHNYIGKLVQAGLLREVTGYARNRIYQAEEILKSVQGFDVG